MKRIAWLFPVVAALAAVTALAQDTSPAPAAHSAAASTQPAEPPAKPKAARRKSVNKREVLDPPVMATVTANAVNLRGQPNFVGEVIGHLQKGESVTVLAEVSHSHPTKDEPSKWSEIVMPTNILVWVDGAYVDKENHTVKAHRINLRGGPSENYSVVGRLQRGEPINEVETRNGWIAINAPTNAHAFVASEFLDMQGAAPVAANTAPEPAPAPTPAPAATETVNVPPPATAPPVAAEPAPATPAPAPAAETNAAAASPVAPAPTAQSEIDQEMAALHRATGEPAPLSTPEAAPAPAATNEPPTEPRVITREGMVHRAYNIQAPTDFELRDISTGDLIDYLQPQTNEKFKMYVGTHVDVTGSEYIDPRWPRTPVLQVTNVELVP